MSSQYLDLPVTGGGGSGITQLTGDGTAGPGSGSQVFTLGITTTKGDLIVRSATANDRLPVGTNGQTIVADSTQTLGVKWAAAGTGDISNGGNTTGSDITIGTLDNFALKFITNSMVRLTLSAAGAGTFAGDLSITGTTTLAAALTGVVHASSGVLTASGIVNADVDAAAAIAFSKLAALTSANILVGSAGNVATSVAMSGDITISNAGVTAIGVGVIVNADINASAAIAFSKLAALTSAHVLVGSAGNVATDVAVTGDIAIDNAGVTSISSGVIVNADISASAAIDFSKLAVLTSANILVGSAGNVATSVAVTGDVVISNAGVTNISSGVIVNADINASAAIDFSKLATLTSANILVGSAGNVATSVAVTGDVVISNAGVTNISSGVIVNADVNAAAAIAGTKISPDFGNQAVITTGTLATGAATINGQVDILAQAELRLQDTTGGQYVGFRASGTQATYTITMPAAAPATNTVLGYDGTNYIWVQAPYRVSTISGNTSAVVNTTYLCDTSGGVFNLTLPSPAISGTYITAKDSTGNFNTNNLTIVRNGAESIDGIAASRVLSSAWSAVTFISNGTNWFMV